LSGRGFFIQYYYQACRKYLQMMTMINKDDHLFESILFPYGYAKYSEDVIQPDFFTDLNLDQIINQITSEKKEYDLKPFFYSPIHQKRTISYRQQVFIDLENQQLFNIIGEFAERMSIVRCYLDSSVKLYYPYHQKGWFLEAALVYCDAIKNLSKGMSSIKLHSKGLSEFRDFLFHYENSDEFIIFSAEISEIKNKLLSIHYNIIIKGLWVRVRKYDDEIDYSAEIEETFSKFKQGGVKDYSVDLRLRSGMNHPYRSKYYKLRGQAIP